MIILGDYFGECDMAEQLSLLDNSVEKVSSGKLKTIISASRRTDVPAFHYNWLQEVLAAGRVQVPNPRFPDKRYQVDLTPEGVHSIVLWSKNFSRVLDAPGYLTEYNLYFQYTINNYSGLLEPNVPKYAETLKILEGLLGRYLPEQFNIRFDPVIISTKGEISPTPHMPEKARLIAFERLCRALCSLGMQKCRITTSYVAMYSHLKNRIKQCGLDIRHMDNDMQMDFFTRLAEISGNYGLKLYSCASPVLEKIEGVDRGQCIDGELLERLFGGRVKKAKDSGQREACGCSASRDIGIYSKTAGGMKCFHGCKYCYVMGGN